MLDVPSITFLSNYLQGYPSTVLVVSHDRAFLNEIATDIVHQHSERLDYYKGANFGKFISCSTSAEVTNTMQNLSTQPRKSARRARGASTKSRWQKRAHLQGSSINNMFLVMAIADKPVF